MAYVLVENHSKLAYMGTFENAPRWTREYNQAVAFADYDYAVHVSASLMMQVYVGTLDIPTWDNVALYNATQVKPDHLSPNDMREFEAAINPQVPTTIMAAPVEEEPELRWLQQLSEGADPASNPQLTLNVCIYQAPNPSDLFEGPHGDNLLAWVTYIFTAIHTEYMQRNGYALQQPIKASVAQRWIRIVDNDSIVAFIDRNGEIYKPASYRQPAKHVRGHINNIAGCYDGANILRLRN